MTATRPQRIQLRRTAGWCKPPGAVKVDRSTKYGNPFPVIDGDRATAVQRFRAWLPTTGLDLEPLRGKDLACWCPLHLECHADVLLEEANR
jgi:hypothetical protein